MNAAGRTVKSGFHLRPELVDQRGSTSFGQVGRIAGDMDDEELLDAKALPHGAKALGFEFFLVDLAAVSGEVDGGVNGLGAAVDINQVIDAVNPVEELLGGGLIEQAVTVGGSNALSVDAVGVQKQSGGVEVALGLTDASGFEDPLEGVLKLDAIGGDGECHG